MDRSRSICRSFKRNTAHSYQIGVLAHDLDPKVFDKRQQVKRMRDAVTKRWYKAVDDTPGLRRTAKLEDTLTFANAEAGMTVAECGHVHINGLVSVRQPSGLQALIFVAEQWGEPSNEWNAPLVSDSLFIGGASAKCGLEGPMSSWLTVNHVEFVDFPTGSSAICACKLCKDIKGGHELRTRNLTFEGVNSRVFFGHHPSANIRDMDGTLTSLGVAGAWMHGAAEEGSLGYFPTEHCQLSDLGHTKHWKMVLLCSNAVGLRTFRWRHVQPQSSFKTKGALVSTSFGQAVSPWYLYDLLGRTSNHHLTLLTGVATRIDYKPLLQFPTDHMGWTAGEVCELRADDHFILEVPTLTNPNRWGVEGNELELPSSLGPLDTLDPARRVHGFWQYAPAVYNATSEGLEREGLLRMMVSAQNGVEAFAEGTDARPACSEDCHEGQRCISLDLTRHECAPVGCFADENACMGDSRAELLSAVERNASWCAGEGGGATDWWVEPAADANVTIPAGATVTIFNCTSALVNRINVFGTLRFADGAPSTLRARYIHVAAYTGRLEAGTLSEPLYSAAKIQLYGNRFTPPYPNSDGLGSKFLVAFGQLSLVGAPLGGPLWSQLRGATAESGGDTISVPEAWVAAHGLRGGDKLIIAPSSLVWDESEVVVVHGCCNATEGVEGAVDVRLAAPLVYDHRGGLNASWLGMAQPFMAAEIALLETVDDRVLNVVVEGMEDSQGALATQQYGASIYVMRKTSSCRHGDLLPPEPSANLSGIRVHHCGQRGWLSRGCINVGPQERRGSEGFHKHSWSAAGQLLVRQTVISPGYNTGIQLDRTHDALVEGNVVADVLSFGLLVEGQRNRILDNLVVHVADSYDGSKGSNSFGWSYRWMTVRVRALLRDAAATPALLVGGMLSIGCCS